VKIPLNFNRFYNRHKAGQRIIKHQNDIPDSMVPESYDFTNIGGYDFMGPVRNQGPCGSCYTVSFVQVIEARLNLKYGK